MLFKNQDDDWQYSKHICRGPGSLTDVIRELKEGRHKDPERPVLGGFSSSIQTCRHFSRRNREFKDTFDPQAVYSNEKYCFKDRYPSMTEVCYEEDWLRQHPDVVETLQTIPEVAKKCSLDENIATCLVFRHECEVVFPGTDVVKYPLPEEEYGLCGGKLSVYVSDMDLDDLYRSEGIGTNYNYGQPLENIRDRMVNAVLKVQEMVPIETPVNEVDIYACNSTYNLKDADCHLYTTLDLRSAREKAKQP